MRTLPILVGLTACFALFQNFSLDNEYRDIRTIAPAGTPAEPPSRYLPSRTGATSLNGLGNEILEHNFGGQVKRIENQLEDWSGINIGRGPAGLAAQDPGSEAKSYRLRTGHLGKDKFGIRYQSDVNVKCEFSALKNEIHMSVDKSLGRNANLSLQHNTEDHKSSLNFSYTW